MVYVTGFMLSRVMMKADPPQLSSELELLPMYHSMIAISVSKVCWNLVMSMGSTFGVAELMYDIAIESKVDEKQ